MPIVRIVGWAGHEAPSSVPADLLRLLEKDGGMDADESPRAIQLLKKGKLVDVYFDYGEHAAARAFIKKVGRFGLQSQYVDDSRTSWYGDPARPWFIRYALGGLLIMLTIWIPIHIAWPRSVISNIATGALLLFGLSVPFVSQTRKAPQTEDSIRRQESVTFWIKIIVPTLLALAVGIIREPWLGIGLGMLATGALASVLIIRFMNRRS